MDCVCRLFIFGFLMAFAVTELNAVNQPIEAEIQRMHNLQEYGLNRIVAGLLGGAWFFAIAKFNGNQLRPALTKGLLLGSLFSLFNSKISFLGAISASACAGGIARLFGFKGWLKAAIGGAGCGLIVPLIVREWIIDEQRKRIESDSDFIRIRNEYDEHARQNTPYYIRAHILRSTLGKQWWFEIEATVALEPISEPTLVRRAWHVENGGHPSESRNATPLDRRVHFGAPIIEEVHDDVPADQGQQLVPYQRPE